LHKLSHSLVAIKSIKKEADHDVKHKTLCEMSLQ
jgi:serine/threonine protein kinase